MKIYDNQVTALRMLLDGSLGYARAAIRQISIEELQKLSDALDVYAVLVDEQLIRYAHQERT